jgi:superfamily II DNA/RNA helicase
MSTKKKTFESLGLKPWLCKQIDKLGMKSPSLIQENCIPEIVRKILNFFYKFFKLFFSSQDVIASEPPRLDPEKPLHLHCLS